MKIKWKTKAIVEISSSVYKFQFLFAADLILSKFCHHQQVLEKHEKLS